MEKAFMENKRKKNKPKRISMESREKYINLDRNVVIEVD